MRRIAPFARKPLAILLPALLCLAGCSGSGFWRYEADTFTLPGANPNRPKGTAENFQRVRHKKTVEVTPLLTETGDIWPGASQPVPTLKDLQKQQTAEIAAGNTGAGLAPLPPLPSLPGYEISSQQVSPPPPPQVFTNETIPTQSGHVRIQGNQGYKAPAGTANGNIVVPNGNGTSTVISPTGQVSTIPTPK